jgi:hypothetical protein
MIATGCSFISGKNQSIGDQDLNQNGIRDRIDTEITRIADGSEPDRLVLEQYARASEMPVAFMNDPEKIKDYGEKTYKALVCGHSIKMKSKDGFNRLDAEMNDSHERSVIYTKLYVAFVKYMNAHFSEPRTIKNCDFDAEKFEKKKQ